MPGGSPGSGEPGSGNETIPFTLWLDQSGSGGGPFDDPNGDGFDLIAEYALALDLPLSEPGTVSRLPRITRDGDPPGSGEPVLEFRVRDGLNTLATGVGYAAQTSADLAHWIERVELTPFETVQHGDGTRTLRIRLTAPDPQSVHSFARLVFRLHP
jgi:hypothetical protein